MCKAPKPPKPKEPKKPQFLRNRYLDQYVGDAAAVKSMRTGRGQLRIPLGGPAPITGRQPGESLVQRPQMNNTGEIIPRSVLPQPVAPRRNPNRPQAHLR